MGEPEMKYLSEGENSDSITIPLAILIVAYATNRGPGNFVVIAKASPESQLLRLLRCLKSRNHVLLLVELPENTALNSVKSLVTWTQVIDGGEFARPSSEVYLENPFDGSDGFRWSVAYRQVSITSSADPDDDDACSCE